MSSKFSVAHGGLPACKHPGDAPRDRTIQLMRFRPKHQKSQLAHRPNTLLGIDPVKITRKTADEKIRFWESSILSEFPSSRHERPEKDCYGQVITRDLVENYLVSQRGRFAEILYQALRFTEGPTICEIGAAFGSCLLPLAKDFGYRVHAFELEENIAAYSKALQKSAVPVSPFDFHTRTDIPIAEREFDFVICSEVVEHLFVDISTVAIQLVKMVRPGGRALITTPNTYRLSNIIRLIRGYNANERHPEEAKFRDGFAVDARTHPREYTMFEVIEAFKARGDWKIVNAWTWPQEDTSTGSVTEFIKTLIFRNFIRLPEGGLIWCVAERTH